MRIATASVRTGFAMTHYKKCGTNPAGGQRRPSLRRGTRNVVRRGVCVEENSEKRKSKKPIAFAIGFLSLVTEITGTQ